MVLLCIEWLCELARTSDPDFHQFHVVDETFHANVNLPFVCSCHDFLVLLATMNKVVRPDGTEAGCFVHFFKFGFKILVASCSAVIDMQSDNSPQDALLAPKKEKRHAAFTCDEPRLQ